MNYFVYLSHSRADLTREVVFSIITLFQRSNYLLSNDVKLLIYTDNKDIFEDYFSRESDLKKHIIYRSIDKDTLRKWYGSESFVHRVKIEMIKDALSNYCESSDKLIYLDSDTFFLKYPMSLFRFVDEDNCLMHCNEGALDYRDNINKVKHCRFLSKSSFNLSGGGVQVPLSTQMWNAGVIGVQGSFVDSINKVLELTDQMYARHKRHNIEQLAFSFVLDELYQIHPTEKTVYHYWDNKGFKNKIDQFLESELNSTLFRAQIPQIEIQTSGQRFHKKVFNNFRQYLKDSI